MLTNSITHKGRWWKAKHYPCSICRFSSLSWLFKKWDDIRHLFGSWRKEAFCGEKRPPRDWASEAATYECCHMHSHKETPTEEPGLRFVPLSSFQFSPRLSIWSREGSHFDILGGHRVYWNSSIKGLVKLWDTCWRVHADTMWTIQPLKWSVLLQEHENSPYVSPVLTLHHTDQLKLHITHMPLGDIICTCGPYLVWVETNCPRSPSNHLSVSLGLFPLFSSPLKWCPMLKYNLRKAKWSWTDWFILYCSLLLCLPLTIHPPFPLCSHHSYSFHFIFFFLSLQRAIIITPLSDAQAINWGLPLSCAHLPWWGQNQ